jgi:excisionase family DNA binding protein
MDEPYAYTRHEAAEFLRVSLRTIDVFIADGTLPSSKVGGRRLIPAAALHRLVDGDNGHREAS